MKRENIFNKTISVLLCALTAFYPILPTMETQINAVGMEIQSEAIDSGDFNGGAKWKLCPDGKLVIDGDGTVPSFAAVTDAPWSENGDSITEIKVENGITEIGRGAFIGVENVKKVTIPFVGESREAEGDKSKFGYIFGGDVPKTVETVVITDAKKIQDNAFLKCKYIKNIILSDGLSIIGDKAFAECSSLTSVNIPDSVIYLGKFAFSKDISVTELTIGEGLEYIPLGAFSYMKSLTDVTVPNTVKAIEDFAFAGCDDLKRISLPFVGKSRSAVGASGTFGSIFGYTSEQTFGDIGKNTVKLYRDGDSFDFSYEVAGETKNIYLSFINGTLSETEKPWYTWQGAFEQTDDGMRYYDIESYYYNVPKTLKKVFVTDAVQISDGAFNNCKDIEYISLNEGITYLNNYSFTGTTFEKITLPDSLTSIEKDAFNGRIDDLLIYTPEDTSGAAYTYSNGMKAIYVYTRKDKSTGMTATVDGNIGLSVNEITDGDVFDNALKIKHSDGKIKVYEMKHINAFGAEKTVGNTVTVFVPLPDGFDQELCRVYVIDGDGNIRNVCARMISGGFMYNTEELKYCVVIEKEPTPYDPDVEIYKRQYEWNSCEWQTVNVSEGGSSFDTPVIGEDGEGLITRTDKFDHVTGDWINDLEAVCAYDGIMHRECTDCGAVIDVKLVPKTEIHVNKWVTEKPATCTVNGIESFVCDECGEVFETREIKAEGHKFLPGQDETKPRVCTVCGKEIDPMAHHNVMGNINVDGATVKIYIGDDEIMSTTAENFKFELNDLQRGSYRLEISLKNYVTHDYEIEIDDDDIELETVIYLKGDVTGDGVVNSRDLSRLYAHVNKTNLLTGYALKCSELTDDDIVNSRDLSRMYAHVNKTNLLF